MTNERFPADTVRTRIASPTDVDALVSLINAAFVVERPIFGGDRTSPQGVRAYLQRGTFLVAEDWNGLAGCVYVELHGDRAYIGLLSVAPARQGSGLGRVLMQAAEDFCRGKKCVAVDLRVVSARTPLPAFYRHLGYTETHTSELPANAHPKIPCRFIHMSKRLEPVSQ
jgi:GNAT superfamily N-acetyltransferase